MSVETLPPIYDSLLLDGNNGAFIELSGNASFAKGDKVSIDRQFSKGQWWYDYCMSLSDAYADGDSSSASSDGGVVAFTLGENVQDHTPFFVDLNFSIMDSPYNKNADVWAQHAKDFVRIAQHVLEKKYELHENSLKCIVLDSGKIWTNDNGTFYKMRLHFPFVDIDLVSHAELLSMIVEQLEANSELNLLLGSRLTCSWSDVVSGMGPEGGFLPLYGAQVNGEPPILIYSFMGRVTNTVEDLDLAFVHPTHTMHLEGMSRYHADINEDDNIFSDIHDAVFWLPIILSTRYNLVRPEVRIKEQEKRSDAAGTAFDMSSSLPPPGFKATRLEKINWFLSLITPETWRHRSYWRSILISLKHEFKSSKRGLDIIKKYSKHHHPLI